MLEELRMEIHDIVQEAVIKTIPKKEKYKKAKCLSEEALQMGVKRREVNIVFKKLPTELRRNRLEKIRFEARILRKNLVLYIIL